MINNNLIRKLGYQFDNELFEFNVLPLGLGLRQDLLLMYFIVFAPHRDKVAVKSKLKEEFKLAEISILCELENNMTIYEGIVDY